MFLRPLSTRLLLLKRDALEAVNRGLAQYVDLPKIGIGVNYRRRAEYPKEYTIKPLKVTNLGGRDPVTGRVVVQGIGGGIKHKLHWVDRFRVGPSEGEPLVERVLEIIKCGCRPAFVALVGQGDKLRYVLASENMKPGDLIRTSGHIPRNAVRANEGDAYPLGALKMGTVVHNVEKFPGSGGMYAQSAGSYVTVVRRVGERIIIQLPSKRELSLAQECMAVVGRVSNVLHSKTPYKDVHEWKEAGNRSRSGLWHRKTGRHGRKIRPLPPLKEMNEPPPNNEFVVKFTL